MRKFAYALLAVAFLLPSFAGAKTPTPKPIILAQAAPTPKPRPLIQFPNPFQPNAGGGTAGAGDQKLTGDPIADLHSAIKRGGAQLILHLKQSYALAMSKSVGGNNDNTSAMCTRALVPIVDLVINGPKAGVLDANDPMSLTADEQALAADSSEPEGVIVKIEKLRILRLALSGPALNDACGALVQDEVKNAQNLVGKITSLITGAGMVGLGL